MWQGRTKKLEVEIGCVAVHNSENCLWSAGMICFLGSSDDTWRESAGLFPADVSLSDIQWRSYFFAQSVLPSWLRLQT